jgi:hypothetical protein
MAKATPVATFATFQGSLVNLASPLKTSVKASSTLLEGSRKPPKCVCNDNHWFANCPYLLELNRASGWSINKDIQAKIDEKLSKNSKLKEQIETSIKRRTQLSSESQTKKLNPLKAVFATLSAFIVDRDSYELKDSWILDSGANSHVCNNSTRFNFDQKASKSDRLISGKTEYQIEAFGSVEITV